MIALLRRATGRMADWIWPRTCAVAACGRPSDRPNRHICSSCFAVAPINTIREIGQRSISLHSGVKSVCLS